MAARSDTVCHQPSDEQNHESNDGLLEAQGWEDYAYNEPGSPPGTLTIDPEAPFPQLVAIDYTRDRADRRLLNTPEACRPYLSSDSVSWIDVQGLGSEAVLQQLGEVFGLHPLLLEDMVNIPQRPKVEEYEGHLLVVLQVAVPRASRKRIKGYSIAQVSLVVGPHYVLTVQESAAADCFEPVRRRIFANKGLIRQHGPDFLAYALIDAVIDSYFPILEAYGDRLEGMQDRVVHKPKSQTLNKIYKLKRELLGLRRVLWPHREAINSLTREGSAHIAAYVRVYLRDCYDHVLQQLDTIENYREMAHSLLDIYLSSVSNSINETMRVLTVISTIFIPLTFIAGVYGMNFEYMPELKSPIGYWVCWLVMLTIAGGLLYFFWKRGWLTNNPNNPQE